MVIDAHAHLFDVITGTIAKGEVYDRRNGEVQWLDGTICRIVPEELYHDGFNVDTLIEQMDIAKIDKALLMQAYYYGIHNINNYKAASKYPDRLKGVGSFDPYAKDLDKIMHILYDEMHFDIFKFEISEGFGLTGIHPEFKINGPLMEKVYKFAAERDIPIIYDLGDKGTKGFQIDEMVDAANNHKELTYVVCHLLAPRANENMDEWQKNMQKLADCENIYFDISALPWNIREPYPYNTGSDFVRRICDMASHERLIWGSDVPCVLTISSYKNQYDFISASEKFTPEEEAWILGKSAAKVYWRDKTV